MKKKQFQASTLNVAHNNKFSLLIELPGQAAFKFHLNPCRQLFGLVFVIVIVIFARSMDKYFINS